MLDENTSPMLLASTTEFRWLDQNALSDIMQLQNDVYRELKYIGKEHFLVPLSIEKRADLFRQGHCIAGAYIKDRLVGHIVFYKLDKKDLLKERYHSLSMVQPKAGSQDYYVISEMVAPDCRRNGLLTKLATWAMAEIYFEAENVNPTIWATVSSINMTGLHCNLRLGMRIVEEGLNKIDGTPVYLLSGKLLPEALSEESLVKAA